MGIGTILRDDKGEFVATKSLIVPSLLSADLGEAMGFAEALSWAKELRLGNVIIEGDA